MAERTIRLSGKEIAFLRAIDFSTGSSCEEIIHSSRLSVEEFLDVANALIGQGFVEPEPYKDPLTEADVESTLLDVNPGYARALRAAMIR